VTISAASLTALAEARQSVETAAEGVRRAAQPAAAAQGAGDSVELSEQAVRLVAAQRQFEAAIELAETADEIARESLDLLA